MRFYHERKKKGRLVPPTGAEPEPEEGSEPAPDRVEPDLFPNRSQAIRLQASAEIGHVDGKRGLFIQSGECMRCSLSTSYWQSSWEASVEIGGKVNVQAQGPLGEMLDWIKSRWDLYDPGYVHEVEINFGTLWCHRRSK